MKDAFLQRIWYGRSFWAFLLLPLSWLFILAAALRRGLFRLGIFSVRRVPVPVVVVGNITVGGTGKTPFVIWLAQALRERGFNPGVITRGYGGNSADWPCDVTKSSDPVQVGDEAVLLAERLSGIVVAGPDRVRTAHRAIELGANLIVSDDGLQHYSLGRDFEIAVIDAARLFGNEWRLPAGPLRESTRRLRSVEVIVHNFRGDAEDAGRSPGHALEFVMQSRLGAARSLLSGESRPLQSFAGNLVHAIAGIGNPESFFDSLRSHGLKIEARALRDHASIAPQDVQFADAAPVLMTEKDAVKCRAFADERCWAVPLEVELDRGTALLDAIVRKLDSKRQAAHSPHSER
jgi:tetraacyldisaccharide 4'-kinase